jgi:hypothetical protein
MSAQVVRMVLCVLLATFLGAGTASGGFLAAGVDSCAKPLAIPDRFDDIDENSAWTDDTDYYDLTLTGYRAPGDIGLQLNLHAGSPPALVPGQYLIANYPPLDQGTPLTGGTWFREWMSGCTPYPVTIEDSLQIEPGNLVSIVAEEVDSLIASDSTAVWDEGSNTIMGSAFEVSPRLVALPFHDPRGQISSGRYVVLVRKVVLFFIESREPGNLITGRIVNVISSDGTPVRPASWGRIKTLYRTEGSP